MCSNPCESELTCFRPESNRGPYGLLNFLSSALSTTELWWRMNHRKFFRTLSQNWSQLAPMGPAHSRLRWLDCHRVPPTWSSLLCAHWRKREGSWDPSRQCRFLLRKNSEALRRTCHEKDLCLGFSSRRSCRSSSECNLASNDSGLLKTLVRRCHQCLLCGMVLSGWGLRWCLEIRCCYTSMWGVDALRFMMEPDGPNLWWLAYHSL